MAFQIKDFRSITAGAINWMKSVTTKVTDFSIGSVVRTMIEGPAAEIDELYIQMFIGLKEAIPVSVYTSFGFGILPAEAASGVVRFSSTVPATSNVVIPTGTVVQVLNGSVVYSTQVEGVITTGNSHVDILVAAQTAGSIGNVGANLITVMPSPITGVDTVNNANPFINGRDLETDDERKTRFQGYISTLARGTISALIYGAKTSNLVDSNGLITEYVAHASVYEPYITDTSQPVAYVKLYIHNGASATSSGLVTQAQKVINGYYDVSGNAVPGWKAAGVRVDVIAATDKSITITGTITVASGFDGPTVRADAADAIATYIQGLDVGATVIESELIAIAKRDVQGVFNIVLSAPTSDVTCLVSEKAIAGTITLS